MKCEICGTENWRLSKKIVTCKKCSFIKARKKYFSLAPEKIYSQNYYHGGDYLDYQKEKKALERNFSNRLKKIRKIIPRGRLLEVGSAYGFFLRIAKNFFEVEGVECNPTVAKEAEKLVQAKVHSGQFELLNLNSSHCNLIVALDTIEHLKSPSKFLRKCHRLLRPGGFLFLETGDVGSFLAKLQGKKWRLIHPPEHLHYFSSRTLKTLLEKTGFRVIKTERVWFWRTVAQIFFKLFPKRFRLWPESLKNIFKKIIIPMNTADLIFVTAQKQ